MNPSEVVLCGHCFSLVFLSDPWFSVLKDNKNPCPKQLCLALPLCYQRGLGLSAGGVCTAVLGQIGSRIAFCPRTIISMCIGVSGAGGALHHL